MQTAVLAMGIGEGGRAGIAIDDSLSTTRTPVKLKAKAGTGATASATTDVPEAGISVFRYPNLIVIPFSCEAAGSEK